MSSLASKLDSVSLGGDRSKLFGYIWRTKQNKKYFFCQNNYIVIPDTRGSALVLCKKMIKDQSQGYICFKCSDMTTFNNLGYIQSLEDMKQDYCEHAKLCTVLFDEEMVEDDKSPENNEVKILQRSPEFITLIHLAKHYINCL